MLKVSKKQLLGDSTRYSTNLSRPIPPNINGLLILIAHFLHYVIY